MVIASIALLAQTALADLITPVGVIASGRMSDPENMIDESGMRVSGSRNDYRNWSSLPATKDTWHEANWFATTHSPGPWAILDLGSVCDLEAISIWNCNPESKGPYGRSVTKLDVYVRKDLCRNNTHENLAAFNPEGWTLLKSDLAVKPNPGGSVVDAPSALLTGADLKGIKTRYVALHIKEVLGGGGELRLATLGEVQVFGTSTTGFVYVPDNKPKGYLTPEKRDDGIKVSDLSAVECDRKTLVGLINRIETGADNRIDSILIAKDGTLMLERYFRRAHIDQLHPARSIIKGVLSLCVGKAIDLGAIKSVDDPILQYFPKMDPAKLVAGIDTWTIKDSLTFSSGLDQKDYKDRLSKQRFKRDTHVAWLLEQATQIDEDKPFQYGYHDPMIINHILSNATGRTFEEYAVEHFFEPMGINDYRFRTLPYGLTYPIDSLQMRSRDLLKIGLLIQNGGVWNGKRLLSAKYVTEATSPHVRHKDRSHGYFWALPDVSVNGTPTKTIMKYGAYGQTIYVVPEHGLVVVFTAGGIAQKKGASETRELRPMLQKDIIPAFVSNKQKANN
jgi:CubicO group peptidase (beta-lactamase class C family)